MFPLAVPAPALLGQPIVVVHRDRGDLFIDPAIDTVQVPDVPAAMVGGIVWTPGALPRELTSTRTSDGRVTVNGTLQVSPDGSATWTADVTASGTASERLRDLLRPLEEGSRVEALRKVVAAGRPDLSRFTAKVVGVDLTRRDVRLTLAGKDEALLVPVGSGLAGRVPALLAPALAAWLPPNLTVTETLAIQFPGDLQILATALPDSVYDESALVVRSTTRQGRRLSLTTEAERP